MKVAILGDSMIKHINGWELSTILEERIQPGIYLPKVNNRNTRTW